MQRLLPRRMVGAVLVAVGVLVPPVMVALSTPAAAATSPDVPAEPVAFGDAGSYGSMAGTHLAAPVVGMATTHDGKGYWLAGSDGGVFAFGDAPAEGSLGGRTLAAPVVGMAATPDGGGYWLVASDGGVFAFGDAVFFGSMGGHTLAAPVVGMATTHDGKGYWLVASDGGVFAFGDAAFHGSMGATHLNKPVVAMAATPGGGGYWLVASDGGVFAFGDAAFHGSMGATHLNQPVVGMAATPDGGGYWMAGSDGGVFALGDAVFFGSMGGQSVPNPVTAVVAMPDGGGYWLLPTAPRPLPTLALGSTGAAVLALQQRLTALGYWVGTPDGSFGDSTQQAVWALQKAAGLPRTGVVNAATDTALSDGIVPRPRASSGYVIQVDLQDDLVMFTHNGALEYTLNTSTGGGYTYTDDGVTSVAITPQGHFEIYRQVDGLVVDSLGALWRPKFFTGGFAIHGDSNVPPEPVSHGCVRVSDEAIDWIWADNLAPLGTAFWVY